MLNDPDRKNAHDVVLVKTPSAERASGERTVVGMEGRYTLDSWRDAEGKHREFTCRVLKMSPNAIELAAPVTGTVGEWAVVHFDRFGKFEGPVIRTAQRTLVVRIVTTLDDRNKVAGKIAWIESKKFPDGRRHERLVPFDPRSTVLLSDGRAFPCQIIDYSIFGAAVFVEHEPAMGAILKIGKVIGRVVRQFPGGFAVEFPVLQHIRTVEQLLTQSARGS